MMMQRFWATTVSFAVLGLALSGCRGDAPQGKPVEAVFAHEASDLPVDESVVYGRLPNGLRYALKANDTPSDTASLLLHFNAGSLDEAESERGLAHFLEHMAFNGSEAFAEGELVKSLERLGLAFGADTNAYTSFDETVYRLELPNMGDDVVDAALGALRETADRLTLDANAIDRERGVIQSELRAGKSPQRTAGEKGLQFYLDGTDYAERLPIGTSETIDTVPAEAFRTFYDGRYRPENATLVMVGDFDVSAMQAKIFDVYGDWAGRGEALPIDRPEKLPRRAPREGLHVDPEITTSLNVAIYNDPDLRDDNVETRRERLLDGIGNSLLNRRFARLAAEGEADFLGASVGSSNLFEVASLTSLTASAKPGGWEPAMAQALGELRKATTYCFTDGELAEWKANTQRGLERAVETSDTRRTPGLASGILGTIDSDRVYTTPESALARYAVYSETINLEDVCERFQSQWTGLDRADLYLQDSVAPEGGTESLRTAFDAALSNEIAADDARAVEDFAYTEWGQAGEVVSRTRVEDIDFTEVEFANGVRLNIKVTDYAKDQVMSRVSVGGGTNNVDDLPIGWGSIASAVLSAGGTVVHSEDELRTILAGRNAYTGIGMGTEMAQLNGYSSTRDMGLMFDLMMADLTASGYRPEAERNFRRGLDAYYDTIDSTAGGVAGRDVPRLIRSGDPRFGIPPRKTLDALKTEDVSAVMEPVLESGLIEIGVVGDMDIDAVIAEVARTFGALETRPTTLPDYPDERRQLRFPKPDTVTLTHEGDKATALFQAYFPAFDGSDTRRARRAGVARAIAQLKLTDVLREREGQSYSPSVGGYFPSGYDDYGYLSVSVSADPEELDAISTLVDEVADEMAAGTITQDEFDRAIRPIRESIEKSLESNSYWLGVIDRARTYEDDLADHRSRVLAYQTMTVDDVKAVAGQLFDTNSAYRVRIIPSG